MPAIADDCLTPKVSHALKRVAQLRRLPCRNGWAGLLALAMLAPAISAQAESSPDERRLQLQLPPPMPAAQSRPAPPVQVQPRPGDQPVLLIAEIRIRGTTIFLESRLAPLVAGLIGKRQDLQALQQATATISAFYRKNGYPLAHAWFPEQPLDDGVLEMRVDEGLPGTEHQDIAASEAWLQPRLAELQSTGPSQAAPTPRPRLQIAANSGQASGLNLNFQRTQAAVGPGPSGEAQRTAGSNSSRSMADAVHAAAYQNGEPGYDNVWVFDVGLRYDLAPTWSLVTFYDVARNGRKQPDAMGTRRMLAGAGFGFEWQVGEGDLISLTAAWRTSTQVSTDADQAPRVDLSVRKSF